MKPYFDTNHLAGLLVLVVALGWGAMELAQYSQTVEARKGATRVRRGGWRLASLVCVAGVNAGLYLAPRAVPAAAIQPGVAAFAVGLVLLIAGLVLRGWSFRTLGDYFTFTVMVSADQPVINAGPYRVLRHPGYAGILLACAGIGVAAGNWVSAAVAVLTPLAFLVVRIRIEERALVTTLGDRYCGYAASHKRLVPLIW